MATTPEAARPQQVSEAYHKLMANPIISRLPNHLKQFIVDQNYVSYSPVDHAVWRYVLRQNRRFLIDYAHKIYFEGLEKTGLKVEAIPSIAEMNDILQKIDWAAVTVDGFIPPAAFMEFQSQRVLVIAADMRQIHHIEYTPSPDIIHEAAGHAPVIADTTYAEYLRRFGEVGTRAMSSKKDYELYEAIRRLSILKEQHDADPAEVDEAEQDVLYKQKNLGNPSEMALLSRLHWWTVEYGLIGPLENPKIYGAGLLSSIGEAFHCFTDEVKKIPYSLEAVNYPFDITTMQPHLFVTPDFDYLITVLEQFAGTMAFRTGGAAGIDKALECQAVSTCQYSSGLQASGIVNEVIRDSTGRPAYLKYSGPVNLAFGFKELPGHGRDYHSDGFGSPIGALDGIDLPLEAHSDGDLDARGISLGARCSLVFESGIVVLGTLEKITRREGKLILLTFSNCRVSFGDRVLFDPSWGVYDMAVGESIVSVFSGAADKDAYQQPSTVSKTRVIKVNHDEKSRRLHQLFQAVRDFREGRAKETVLVEAWRKHQEEHSHDWLLPMELIEIIGGQNILPELEADILGCLEKTAIERKELSKLITDGLSLVYPDRYKTTVIL